ncbi:TPA: hypothetical protein QEL15_003774 [Stenotrophomonas maltophilia]|nr:hypothetical protein [Stenotrophomonas maltophilia]
MPLLRSLLVFALALPLGACGQSDVPRNMSPTQTNEQGCTRKRSIGPQDAYAVPVPLKQACVGPYLLELPQNYYYNQMGPEHDGSFALALEYPTLLPFKPGERINPSVDVGIRTVTVSFSYISRLDARQALRNQYTPMEYEKDDPAASLATRIKGDSRYGLIPYYADLERIRAFDRKRMGRERAPGVGSWYQDWFVASDDDGQVQTFIWCTSREAVDPGVEFRDGKLVKNANRGVPECVHWSILPGHRTLVKIRYPRVALESWLRTQERAHQLFVENTDQQDGGEESTTLDKQDAVGISS